MWSEVSLCCLRSFKSTDFEHSGGVVSGQSSAKYNADQRKTAMSRINYAVAGSFMYSNLLTSVDDDEIEYWSLEVSHYCQLLEMHSVSFDITKLAAARMRLLASASQGYEESGGDVGLWDIESILKTVQ